MSVGERELARERRERKKFTKVNGSRTVKGLGHDDHEGKNNWKREVKKIQSHTSDDDED